MKKLKEFAPVLLTPIILVGVVYLYRFYILLAKIIQIENSDYSNNKIFALIGVFITLVIITGISWKYIPE